MNACIFILSPIIFVLTTIAFIISVHYQLVPIILLLLIGVAYAYQYYLIILCAKIVTPKNGFFGLSKTRIEDNSPLVVSSSFVSMIYKYLSYNEIVGIKDLNVINSENIYLTTFEDGIYYMYYKGDQNEIKKEVSRYEL